MAYTFEQVLAVDPSNPANVARAASITIFAPGDAAKTPLTLTDTNGSPLANPLTVNANGFGPALMHATLDRVAWEGGGFTGFLTSYEGMKQEAIDARAAAETAAATAGADAAAVADAAIGDATAEAEAAAASAEAAEAAAASSATAAANSAALVNAPADTAIAAAINGNGATKTALNATILSSTGVVAAPAPSGGDDTAALQAIIDGGAASIRLKSFASYNVTSLTAPARELTFEGIGSTLAGTTSNPIIVKNGTFRVGFVGVNTSLQSEANKVTDALGRIHRFGGQVYARAERDSDRGALDFANFAGQGVSTAITGFLFHNYTDSTAVRIDNVGSGSALVLKNAQNPLRRNDKEATYVGTGHFLRLIAHDDVAGIGRDLFFVDKDGRMVWTGATTTAGTGGRARFLANKADDGNQAFLFELTSPHLNVASFSNVLDIRNDNSLTRATLKSNAAQTGGIMLESGAGPIFLTPSSGSYIQLGGKLRFTTALTQTTVGAAGAAAALPATPSKYYQVTDSSGATFVIPAYAVS